MSKWRLLTLTALALTVTVSLFSVSPAQSQESGAELNLQSFRVYDYVSVTRQRDKNHASFTFASCPQICLKEKAASAWPELAKTLKKVNEKLRNELHKTEKDYLQKSTKGRNSSGRALCRSCKIVRADRNVVSLQLLQSSGVTDMCGAPSAQYTTFVLEPKSGRICSLADLIPSQYFLSDGDGNKSPIQRRVISELYKNDEIIAHHYPMYQSDDYGGSKQDLVTELDNIFNQRKEKYSNTPIPFHFVVTDRGVRFLFSRYTFTKMPGCAQHPSEATINYADNPNLFTPWGSQLFAKRHSSSEEELGEMNKSYVDSPQYKQLIGQWKLVSATVKGQSRSAQELGMQASVTFTPQGSMHYLYRKGSKTIDDSWDSLYLCLQPLSTRLGDPQRAKNIKEPADASGWMAFMHNDMTYQKFVEKEYRATLLPDGQMVLYRLVYDKNYAYGSTYSTFRGVFKRK